jgi:phage FluMu gp28-like protein
MPATPGSIEAAARESARPKPQGLYVSAKTEATAKYWYERSELARKLDGPVLWVVVEMCYDYQLTFLFDDSRYRCWVASRQIGKSFALALSAVLQALVEPRRDQIIISASMDLAVEVMDKVNKHLDVLEGVFGLKLRADSKEGSQSKRVVTVRNASRIISRPASKRSIRSFHGDAHWDETGLTPWDREIYKAVYGVASRHGYRIAQYSTPFGDTGVFFDCARGELSRGYSQHTTTVHDAVRQGCPIDVEDIRAHVDDETFAQEYECQFISDTNSYFPWELLRKFGEKGSELLARVAQESESAGGSAVPRREWYGGMDVGRKRDLSAQTYGEFWPPTEELLVHPTDVLKKAPFPEQKQWFEAGVHVHQPVRVIIDGGGLGMERAEDLEREFPGTVRAIDFGTNQVKRRMVEGLRLAIERGLAGIHPGDRTALVELHSIRKKLTAQGKITYTADRTDDGHADRATAVMLCALAAYDGRPGFFAVVGGAEDEDEAQTARPMGPELPPRMAQNREFQSAILRQFGMTGAVEGGEDGYDDPWTEV